MRTWWLVAALLVGCGGAKKYTVRPVSPDLKVDMTPERVARGGYLVNSIGACGVCHNGRPEGELFDVFDEYNSLLGGFEMDNPDMKMSLWIPNITSHPSGIGSWTDDELMRGIRDGIRPDGERLFPMMPIMQYQYMSDEDVASIVAYLRTTPPVDNAGNRDTNQIPLLFKVMMGGVGHDAVSNVPEPDRDDPVAYGAYLAKLGHCSECHSAAMKPRTPEDEGWLAGSVFPFKEPTGKYPAPNLTSHEQNGLGAYTAEQIAQAIRTGRNLDGTVMMPPMSFFADSFRNLTDEDLDALTQYLASLPPVEGKAIPRVINERGEEWIAKREAVLAAREKEEAEAAVAAEAEADAEDEGEGEGEADGEAETEGADAESEAEETEAGTEEETAEEAP